MYSSYNFVHTGGHLGRDKTYHKIAERFYWKLLWKDVHEYVRTCEVCQRTNDAKFVKEAAPLHPIPVKPEVWRQVRICSFTCYCFCKEIEFKNYLQGVGDPGTRLMF